MCSKSMMALSYIIGIWRYIIRMRGAIVITCCWRNSLHVGILRQLILANSIARKYNLEIYMRLDNSDGIRSIDQFQSIMSQVASFSTSLGYYQPHFFESHSNIAMYRSAARDLVARGLAYNCLCDSASSGCVNSCSVSMHGISGESCIRLNIQRLLDWKSYQDYVSGARSLISDLGDVVLLKSNRYPTFFLANAVDNNRLNGEYFIWDRTHNLSSLIHYVSFALYGHSSAQVSLGLLLDHQRKKLTRDSCLVEYGVDWASYETYIELGYSEREVLSLLAKTLATGPYPGRPYSINEIDEKVMRKEYNIKDSVLPFREIHSIRRYYAKL